MPANGNRCRPMIRLREVSKTFKRNKVLDGIDLELGIGERVALIGSNGAGKTTLIRCLLGEYTHEGSVSIDGLSPREHRTRVLAGVGFVPQQPPPLKMPVGQLVEFAASLCGSDARRMSALAGRLGLNLDALWSRPFVKLSGGMKQKLLIVIALGRDAKILMLDEPAASLDPEARKVFFELLAERQDDALMLISSHRLNEISSLVNRVVEMDLGKVVLDDRVADDLALTGLLACRVVARRADPALARALSAWKLCEVGDGLEWEGVVAGPDRLRFLGTISRYVAIIRHVSLEERDVSPQERDV